MKKILIFMMAIVMCFAFAGCGDTADSSDDATDDIPDAVVTVSSIVLSGDYTTRYAIGESFDATGLVVTAKYSDGTTAAVTGYTLSNTSALTLDDKTITVTYESKTAKITITVYDPDATVYVDDSDDWDAYSNSSLNPLITFEAEDYVASNKVEAEENASGGASIGSVTSDFTVTATANKAAEVTVAFRLSATLYDGSGNSTMDNLADYISITIADKAVDINGLTLVSTDSSDWWEWTMLVVEDVQFVEGDNDITIAYISAFPNLDCIYVYSDVSDLTLTDSSTGDTSGSGAGDGRPETGGGGPGTGGETTTSISASVLGIGDTTYDAYLNSDLTPALTYEAEHANVSEGTMHDGTSYITACETASGGYDVEGFADEGKEITWTITSSKAATVEVAIRTACSLWDDNIGANSTMTDISDYIYLTVNDVSVDLSDLTLECKDSSSWYEFSTLLLSNVSLVEGDNVITMGMTTGGYPNTDVLYVYSTDADLTLTAKAN